MLRTFRTLVYIFLVLVATTSELILLTSPSSLSEVLLGTLGSTSAPAVLFSSSVPPSSPGTRSGDRQSIAVCRTRPFRLTTSVRFGSGQTRNITVFLKWKTSEIQNFRKSNKQKK